MEASETAVATEELQEEEEKESFLSSFRSRLLDPRRLNLQTRIVLGLALAQVVAVTVLLAIGFSLPADIEMGYVGVNIPAAVPFVVYALTICSFFVGALLSIVAVTSLDRTIRSRIILGVVLVLGVRPGLRVLSILQFWSIPTVGPNAFEFPARIMQLCILILLVLTVILAPVRATARMSKDWPLWMWVTGALLVYYGLDAYLEVTTATRQGFSSLFEGVINGQVVYLWIALSLVYILAGTDIAELGEAVGVTVIHALAPDRLRRFAPAILSGLLIVVAAGVLADIAHRPWLTPFGDAAVRGALPPIIVATCVVLGAVTLAAIAGIGERWPEHMPTRILYSGALFLFSSVSIVILLQLVLQALNDETSGSLELKGFVATGVILVVGLLWAMLRLVHARRVARPALGVGALLIALCALVALPQVGPQALTALWLRVPMVDYYPDALQLVATVCALGYALYAALRTRLSGAVIPQLSSVLLLIVSMEALHLALVAPTFLAQFGLTTGAPAAGVILLAIMWDIFTSGKDTTNTQAATHIVQARVTLFLAYTLLGSATLLLFASERIAGTQRPVVSFGGGSAFDHFTNFGIYFLGMPVLAQIFFQRTGRWHARVFPVRPKERVPTVLTAIRRWGPVYATLRAVKSVAALVATGIALVIIWLLSLRLVQVAVGLSAIIAVALVIQLTLTAGQFEAYQIPVPGPQCTAGDGALWSYNAWVHFACQPNGMRMELAPGHPIGVVSFHTASNHFVGSYAVGVTVDVSHLTYGCVMIGTDLDKSAPSHVFFVDYVCTDGHASMLACIASPPGCYQLSDGVAALTPISKLTVTLNGLALTFGVNGQRMAGSLPVYDGTIGIDLGLMGDPTYSSAPSGYVTYSDFTYTPLN